MKVSDLKDLLGLDPENADMDVTIGGVLVTGAKLMDGNRMELLCDPITIEDQGPQPTDDAT